MIIKPTSAAGRLIAISITLILGVGVFAACSTRSGSVGEPPTGERIANSYPELLQSYLEQEENPFVKDVLTKAIETGGITQAQYDEAHRLYTECMENAGYQEEQRRLSSGIIQLTPPELVGMDAVEEYMKTGSDCSDELAPIEALYRTQQGNPDLLTNGEEVVVGCLKRGQLVDISYTATNFKTDLEDQFKNAPYNPNDPAVQACFSAGGYSIAIEEKN